MATIRGGNIGALLVVDAQVGVMKEAWNAAKIIDNILLVIERARAKEIPVIWVQHSDENLVLASSDWQLVPTLIPKSGEVQIQKHFNSSFENTELEEILSTIGVSHITLVGAASSWCIRATAYGALERGYDLTLVKDGHTTGSLVLEGGEKIDASSIVQELNLVMTWFSYPGRKNNIVEACAASFAI